MKYTKLTPNSLRPTKMACKSPNSSTEPNTRLYKCA